MENWFSEALLIWYQNNKRDLPWRREKDPYKIWLSEVILQQTQVKQGLDYYDKFLSRFPNLVKLAKAKEDEVLKLWQGLGYYTRARNMHRAAKLIFTKHGGTFPVLHQDIKALPGVGDYTAAAISSFCYNQAYAVVDGNVYRLLSRVFGLHVPTDTTSGKNTFQELANRLLDPKNPSQYNQAIMEFGSQYCKPRQPDCESCIFSSRCEAFKMNTVQQLPCKKKQIKIRNRYFNYLVLISSGGQVVLQRRESNDIWKGLYDFVLVESPKPMSIHNLLKSENLPFRLGNSPDLIFSSPRYLHQLSHQKIQAKFYVIKIKGALPKKGLIIDISKINRYAMPRLIDKFLKDCDLKELL